MIKEFNYISIKEILSRMLRHPLMQDLNLEQVVQYTIDFIEIFGMPSLFQDKEELVHIEDYRGLLPCDCLSIDQVMDCKTNKCLRSMTDTFKPNDLKNDNDLSFKTQGRVIFTSFKKGDILIAFKAIPVDDEGFPLLIDNAVYLRALEAYIKKEVFTILFDMNRVSAAVLQNVQQDYAWKAGQLQSEFTLPSVSEMESIKNMWTTLIEKTTRFDNRFSELGRRQYIKNH